MAPRFWRRRATLVHILTIFARTSAVEMQSDRLSVHRMLYGLVVLLLVVAVALFLAKVAVGGGIIGILALILLVYVVMNAPKRV